MNTFDHPIGTPWSYELEINSIACEIKDQDYNIVTNIWYDIADCDDDPGSCTLENWINCKDAGYLSIHSHGNIGKFCGPYFLSEIEACDWISSQENMEAKLATTVSWECSGNTIIPYYASINAGWVANNWSGLLKLSNAIVMTNSCMSSWGNPGDSFSKSCGGGVGFGYSDFCSGDDRVQNNYELLSRMNGLIGNGQYREAHEAYNDMPAYLDQFEIVAQFDIVNPNEEKYITLCPTTKEYYPADGDVVDGSGIGYLLVDTYCNALINAEEALAFTTSGNVQINNIQWVDVDLEYDRSDKIQFEWSGSGDFTVDVHVHHDKFQSWGLDNLGYHCLDWDGIAPNTEDGLFAFSSEQSTGDEPIADFIADANTINTGIPVYFYDQSVNNPTSWSWSFYPTTMQYYFGTNSSSQYPIVGFNQMGHYDVTLSVSNSYGSDTETKLNFINSGHFYQTINPDFSPKNPTIIYDNSISFTDLSEVEGNWGEIVGWIWEFEGGVPSYSFEQNPTILYPTVGSYSVSLKVYTQYGTSSLVYGNVGVYSDDFLLVHLDYNAPVPYPDCPVYFSCDVYGGLGNYKYDWVFGDGGTHTTYSPENTCTWQYQNAQTWLAYVDVQDLDQIGLSQQSDVVEVEITLQPDVTAYFEINGDILQKNEPFKVYDYSVPPDLIESWSINFGYEGYGSSVSWGPDPIEYLTHTYEDEGLYDINLNVSTVWYPAIEDDFNKTVQVVDCNNGEVVHCDFSNLTSGWNFPIVAQELVIGGDCPPGIDPVVPSGAQVSLFAPGGIRLKDGFHVTATDGSSFKAIPTCPVNYVENSIDNGIVANDFNKTGFIQPQEEPEFINSTIDGFNENHGYEIYPNPTNNLLNIYFTKEEEGLMEIELKDATGKTVYNYTGKMEKHTVIDLSNYQKGIYLLKVKTAGIASVQKVIRQ